jgi:hypothetical protein
MFRQRLTIAAAEIRCDFVTQNPPTAVLDGDIQYHSKSEGKGLPQQAEMA